MLPQYQMNPINDYYFRNAQFQQFPPVQQAQNQIVTRFVTSIEEAKASMIDGLSTNLFLDSGNGKIYLKRLSNNGTSDFYVYSIEETNTKDPMAEINNRLANIESIIGGLANGKSLSVNADEPDPVVTTAVAEPHGANAETEPTGLSKGYGNDKWQKRR